MVERVRVRGDEGEAGSEFSALPERVSGLKRRRGREKAPSTTKLYKTIQVLSTVLHVLIVTLWTKK